LKGDSIRLIDLEDEKYGDQVQLELRKHAHKKVNDLVLQKKYSKALAYFASSLLGRRAQNTQWIDITFVQLRELPERENDLRVRRLLEAMPQELDALLNYAWQQIFLLNENDTAEIKEMLRVLVLTYEDPTLAELALLVGLNSVSKPRTELRDLVLKCRPLLVLKRTSQSDTKVCFIEGVVRAHLQENAYKLLGLSEEDTKLQHGMLGLRAFTHILEALSFPVAEVHDEDDEEDDNSNEVENLNEAEESTTNSQQHKSEHDETEQVAKDPNDSSELDMQKGDDNDKDPYASEEEYEEEEKNEEDEEEDEDPEASILIGKALAYPIKHWLHHASKATAEIAEDLSFEKEFWDRTSIIRRRWLTEYVRLTGSFKYFQRSELSGLHIAAAVGFRQLVAALMKNGYEDEKSLRNSEGFTPVSKTDLYLLEVVLTRASSSCILPPRLDASTSSKSFSTKVPPWTTVSRITI
jgi:hypothetical protein